MYAIKEMKNDENEKENNQFKMVVILLHKIVYLKCSLIEIDKLEIKENNSI